MPDTLNVGDIAEVLPETATAAPAQSLQMSDIAEVEDTPQLDVAEVLPGNAPKETTLQEFQTKGEADLDKDLDFSPVQFGSKNREALLNSPADLQKLSRIYRSKETRGTTFAQKAKSVVSGTPAVIKALGSGIGTAIEKVAELNPIAIGARIAGAASSNVPGATDIELRKIAGEEAEIPASVEAAAAGSGDLLRRSGRAVKEFAGKALPGVSSKAELSDEEWRDRLINDISGLEQAEKAGQGGGEAIKALGLDADELEKSGIKVNPQTIQELSVISDPVNFIPFGAAVGAVTKVGGKLGTKLVATALTAEQAANLAKGLNLARDAAAGTGKLAGSFLETVGAAVEKGGGTLGGVTRGLRATGVGAALGTGANLKTAGALFLGPKIIEKAGTAARVTGELLTGAREVPTALRIAGEVGGEFAKGAAEGGVLAVPFFLGARPEEEEFLSGAVGVGGLARVAATQVPKVAKAAGAAAQDALAKKIFEQVDQAEAPQSATYGTDPNLDTIHEATKAKLDPRSQKLLDWTREVFRDSGIEVYALDDATFAQRAGTGDAYGFALNTGEKLAPNGTATPLFQIFLNGNTEALPHELFHALREIDPAKAEELSAAVQKSWTPEQKTYFTQLYNTLLNGGKPEAQWTRRLSEAGIAEEAGAEVFSRLFLGEDLRGVEPSITKKAATFLSGVLEKIGAPLGKVGAKPGETGVSTLGIRPGAEPTKIGQEWLANISDRIQKNGSLLPEERGSKIFENLQPSDITTTGAPVTPPGAPVTPPGALVTPPVRPPTPKPIASPAPTASRNIRVMRQQQNDFAAKRAAETGVAAARPAAEKLSPEAKQHFDSISKLIEEGSPVVEIEHSGVRTQSGGESAVAGRTERRLEQEAAYIAEGQANAPADIRDTYQKVFVPVRWETVKGIPQLLAMSLDKVIANVHRVVKDTAAKKAEALIPYDVENGKLTDAAWNQVVEDLQGYTANQANGYRGDGEKLVRPTTDIGVSIPAENPAYNPTKLSEDRTQFLNLVQGLNPPLTARAGKGTPGNVKGQIVAELQGRKPETPSVIRPEDISKQEFKGTGRTVKETNPLRNELAKAGVPVRELIEVTERINVDDVVSTRARPDLNFNAPVTDVIRGGFLPGKETADAVKAGLLQDPQPSKPTPSKEIRDLASGYAKAAGIDYAPSRNYSGLNPDLGKKLADFYEAATSNPTDEKVAASYKALADETLAQYKAITDAGYKIEPFEGTGEPYKSSAEAIADIRDNKHLYFLKTENAFSGDRSNPLLADAGNGLVVNDVFRAVHDFFGHGKEGYQFGPRGEFNAWRAHSEMYSPAAQGALAAETLAQNSWVNFGKHLRDAEGNIPQKGQPGYVPMTERPFSEQKNIVIPDELIAEAKSAATTEPKFLPDNKSIEQFGREILDSSAGDWKKANESWDGGLTAQAYRTGLEATDRAYVDTLAKLRDEASANFKAKMADGDFEGGYVDAAKSQFFSEAYGAATGGKSARNGMKVLGFDESKIPFPESGKLLPKTEKGKELAGKGFDFEIEGQKGIRAASIIKDGEFIGSVRSAQRSPTSAEIVSASLKPKFRGKGLGEAAYRELLTQLKDDGVTEVSGMMVAIQPFEIRKKIFGEFERLEGPDGEISVDEARKILTQNSQEEFHTGVEGYNTIRPDKLFLPATDFAESLDPIAMAAIRTAGGRVFTGAWHGEALTNMVDAAAAGAFTEKLPPGLKTLSDLLEGDAPEGFIEDGYVTKSGKFLNRAQALDHAERINQLKEAPVTRGSFRDAGVLETNEFEGLRKFQPKKKKSMEQEVAETDYSKYDIQPKRSKTPKLTGWILPNKKFVGLDTEYHEQHIAENAEDYNKRFGTDFGKTADIDERLDALNHGFVRIRYSPDGMLRVEANASKFSEVKKSILQKIENSVDDIDRILLSLSDNKGNQVDMVTANVSALDGPERLNALTDAVDSLRPRGGKFLPREKSHDYNPSDDYKLARIEPRVKKILGEEKTRWMKENPEASWSDFDLVPVKNLGNNVAKYVDGTSSHPVVVIDVDSHLNAAEETGKPLGQLFQETIRHELEHAVEDSEGSAYSERRAERKSGKFLPGESTLPGLGLPSEEKAVQERLDFRIKNSKNKFPESLPLQYRRDEQGNFIIKGDGKPAVIAVDYDLLGSPLAKEVSKGLKGAAREDATVDALSTGLEKFYRQTEKNPEIKAGAKWYSTARTRLKKLLGDDSKFFAELLGATSARTPVETNFRFALDAYNRFKGGEYDAILKKYREGKQLWESQDFAPFLKTWKSEEPPTRNQFLDWWVEKHDLVPVQSNGKKFGANSRSVLRVLDGSWASEVQGPKTPNFAGNLSGDTFEATIDVWAMRALHRMANEGKKARWRIMPENETGVSDADFYIGQKAFRKAADALGIKPDALQAVLWFAEKDVWEKRGWTRGAGAEKSDFNSLLAETERTDKGLRRKTPQSELDFSLNPGDITAKNK